jgi:hypothetical protein
MKRPYTLLAAIACLNMASLSLAQQQPAEARVEAKKEVTVTINWTLGEQAWNFKEILSTYEPVKGYLEPRGNQGTLAVWKLRLVKDLEPGAAKLHEEIRNTPFQVVLLDADRTVIDADAPVGITMVTGKMDDTIELYVTLPEDAKLKQVKLVRVQRRTNVGFLAQ